MYSTLLKEVESGKMCGEKLKIDHNSAVGRHGSTINESHSLLQNAKKLSGLPPCQEEKCPEVSMRMFFEIMRTAYQVNDSFDELASVVTANSEIDWSGLAKINLNLDTADIDNEQSSRPSANNKSLGTEELAIRESQNSCNTERNKSSYNKISDINRSRDSETGSFTKNSQGNIAQSKTSGEAEEEQERNYKKEQSSEECKRNKNSAQEIIEPLLAKAMKRKLSDVLHEGLLDSVLPYLVPKPAFSQPTIKKPSANIDAKKSISTNSMENRTTVPIMSKDKDKDKSKQQKKSYESEVEIHVCDEAKNIKKDFRCPQKLLIQKMCYFADVTAGQKLEEMDISVHCDIVIFDWLMRWVKKDIIKKSEWPVLEASNVIPIMVSASFLQMEPLLENCLSYCYNNMSEVLKTSTILTCLNDHLLTRLADFFSNADVESIKDKKDKIQSRLFCKLILALGEPTSDQRRGHFSSLATLFKCGKCGKNIISAVSASVPCIPSAMRLDNKGNLHSKHTRDPAWNLNDYILTLRSELRSWRKVYWRLWGDCHFLHCQQCCTYFPVNQIDWCYYHPEIPQFFVLEQQGSTPFPLGRYPCCSQRAYRFEALPNPEGCRFREHSPLCLSETDEGISNVFSRHRDVIVLEPPQLFFPEKITRLAERDPSLQPGKLICKESMWWDGIEIAPPRAKLGLLGKIWGGSGLRKPCQVSSQKAARKMHQTSQATDASSTATSGTDSEEDNVASGCEYSSAAEESSYSEESHKWPALKRVNRKPKYHLGKRNDGGGSWSENLIVRYNQDNQRDFEEKATLQMEALLTKRVSAERGLLPKSYVHGKVHGHSWNNNTPLGGTYVKLEADFREQLAQAYKSKNSSQTKGSLRNKSSKV